MPRSGETYLPEAKSPSSLLFEARKPRSGDSTARPTCSKSSSTLPQSCSGRSASHCPSHRASCSPGAPIAVTVRPRDRGFELDGLVCGRDRGFELDGLACGRWLITRSRWANVRHTTPRRRPMQRAKPPEFLSCRRPVQPEACSERPQDEAKSDAPKIHTGGRAKQLKSRAEPRVMQCDTREEQTWAKVATKPIFSFLHLFTILASIAS